MKRTKEWWTRLTKEERTELVALERADRIVYKGSAYFPDNYTECTNCSTPTEFGGLCPSCLRRLLELINKANRDVKNENI